MIFHLKWKVQFIYVTNQSPYYQLCHFVLIISLDKVTDMKKTKSKKMSEQETFFLLNTFSFKFWSTAYLIRRQHIAHQLYLSVSERCVIEAASNVPSFWFFERIYV